MRSNLSVGVGANQRVCKVVGEREQKVSVIVLKRGLNNALVDSTVKGAKRGNMCWAEVAAKWTACNLSRDIKALKRTTKHVSDILGAGGES